MSYDELKAVIAEGYPRLSPQRQRIARFAIERPDDVALGTVAAVAASAGVPPSALIRFAHAVGFEGFSALQQVFRAHLVARASALRDDGARTRRTDALRTPVEVAAAELARLCEAVRAEDVKAAAKLLASAGGIHVLGQRRAFALAVGLAHALDELGLPARLLDGMGGTLASAARGIGSGDVLVAAILRDDAPEVVDTARACRERGAKVVALADTMLTPLRPLADVCLATGADAPARSLAAPVCLAEAIATAAGAQKAASTVSRRPGAAARKR